MYVEENQLLNGGGTGTDLNGVYTQATAYSAPITVAAPTKIDVLRLAMLQAVIAELSGDRHRGSPDRLGDHRTDEGCGRQLPVR
jgi:hypothetical protein